MSIENCPQSGSIIGFSGCLDPVANTINLFTGGLPGIGVHHVGIILNHDGEPWLYESTTNKNRPTCGITGKLTKGVQAHPLAQIQELDEATIWHYPLRRALYEHEEKRLGHFLGSKIGLPYDMAGAIRSGGIVFGLAEMFLHPENLSSLFCSEFCAASLIDTGIMDSADASRWNPNKLTRFLRRSGKCSKPLRLSSRSRRPF